MRIFAPRRRMEISVDNEKSVFQDEWQYYTANNQFPVSLFGKRIVNINKRINVQAVLGYGCNHDCRFCVEKDRKFRQTCDPLVYAGVLRDIVRQYHDQGIFPSVSITGGEPLFYMRRLRLVAEVLRDLGVERYNLNTNGSLLPKHLEELQEMRIPFVNVSRHSHVASERDVLSGRRGRMIFDVDLCRVREVLGNVCLQAVMCKGGLDGVESLTAYMDHYIDLGFRQFSFRGLSVLDESKLYGQEIAFTKKNWVDVFAVISEVARDPRFEFVQQKVGDHYLYEIWKYRGCTFRFTYSNLNLLRSYENAEREAGNPYSRATILYPDGRVTSGWCDTHLIKSAARS